MSRIATVALGALSLSSLSLPAQGPTDPTAPSKGLTVAFVNVQWGDATVVVGPTGKCMVIDGGGNGMGTQAILPTLRKLGVKRVDHAVATHYHGDHIGGLDEVIRGLPTSEVWDRGTRNANYGGSYGTYVRAAGNKRRTVRLGQIFDLGGGARARVLAFDGWILGSSSRRPIDRTGNYENSSSIVVRVEYGDFSLWVGGDLTGGGHTYDMETPVSKVCGDVDVYLANHHGWHDGSNQNLLKTIDPEVVVISASHKNTHNVPHRVTLDRMSTRGKNRLIVGTTPGSGEPGFTTGGTMTLTTDGFRYTIRAQNGQSMELYTDEFTGNRPRAGDLVISELHRSPGRWWGEYIELFNRGGAPVNLGGITFRNQSGWFTLGASHRVLPGQHVIIGAHGDPSRNGGLPFAHSWPALQFRLHNDRDDLRMSYGSVTLDRLQYTFGFPGKAAISAERVDPGKATTRSNFRSATARYGADRGTPGAPNQPNAGVLPLTVGVEVVPHDRTTGPAIHFFANAPERSAEAGVIGLSMSTSPGMRFGSTLVPLQPDALFRLMDGIPGFVFPVPSKRAHGVRLPIPRIPGLRGTRAFCAHYLIDLRRRPAVLECTRASEFRFP